MHDIKVARQKTVPIPAEVCLSCFNTQQQLSFPFLVYCPHREVLAVIHSPDAYATFRCAPQQLSGVLRKLQGAAERSARDAGGVAGQQPG